MEKTLFYEHNHKNDTRGRVVIRTDENGSYFAKWAFDDDSHFTLVNVKQNNYHYLIGERQSEMFCFGGWAYWLDDVVN